MALSTIVFVTLGLTAAIGAAVTALAWRHRGKPGGLPLFFLMLAVTWWTVMYAGELAMTAKADKLVFARLQWFATVWVPVAWLLFSLEYSGHDEYVNRETIAVLSFIPLVSIAAVWTYPYHNLVRHSVEVVQQGDLFMLEQTWGPIFWLAIGYTYLLGLSGSFLLIQLAATSPALFRDQIVAMLIAALAPWLSNVAYVLGVFPVENLDLTPVGFTVTGIAALGAITRFRLLRVSTVPSRLARALVVGNMEDGVVVIDTAGRIVDANESAGEILGDQPVVGKEAAAVIPGYETPDLGDETQRVVPIRDAHEIRYYDIRASGLRDHHDRVIGTVAVLRDVTANRRHKQRLDVLNRVLRHNLRNEMNVVMGYADRAERGELGVEEFATKVKSRALEVVELGDTARSIEELLSADVEPDSVPAAETIESVVERVSDEYPDARFSVTDRPSPEIGVAEPFEAILEHLVENAAEHVDEPMIEIAATAADGRLHVTVRDDGPGLPETERLVFESETETMTRHGEGLGLWLVNWGVRELGGTVTISENEPTGTLVTIELPYTDVTEQAAESVDLDPSPASDGAAADGAGSR